MRLQVWITFLSSSFSFRVPFFFFFQDGVLCNPHWCELILLPPSPRCWDYRPPLPHLAFTFFNWIFLIFIQYHLMAFRSSILFPICSSPYCTLPDLVPSNLHMYMYMYILHSLICVPKCPSVWVDMFLTVWIMFLKCCFEFSFSSYFENIQGTLNKFSIYYYTQDYINLRYKS